MKELERNELELLAEKQQAMIKNLLAFTKSTTDALDTVSSTMEMLQDNIASLQMAQNKLQETVLNFLAENEVDFRPTEGGTG